MTDSSSDFPWTPSLAKAAWGLAAAAICPCDDCRNARSAAAARVREECDSEIRRMLGAPVIVSPTASPRRIPAPGGFVCAPDQGMQSRLQVLDAAERKSPAAPESPAEPSPLPRVIFASAVAEDGDWSSFVSSLRDLPEPAAGPSPLPRGIFGALEHRRNAPVSGYAHFGVDEDV
ncbi:MAG: hypothetical protein ABSG83_19900 [Roseiarcus sp.]